MVRITTSDSRRVSVALPELGLIVLASVVMIGSMCCGSCDDGSTRRYLPAARTEFSAN